MDLVSQSSAKENSQDANADAVATTVDELMDETLLWYLSCCFVIVFVINALWYNVINKKTSLLIQD